MSTIEPRRGRFWVAALTAAVLAGCGQGLLLGPDADQGIDGIALLGPICPVQSVDDPCPDRPYQAWIWVRSAIGAPLTRVHTGEDGRFRVGLAPGRYILDPEGGDPFPSASVQEVEVVAGVYTEVVVSFDTGIR